MVKFKQYSCRLLQAASLFTKVLLFQVMDTAQESPHANTVLIHLLIHFKWKLQNFNHLSIILITGKKMRSHMHNKLLWR